MLLKKKKEALKKIASVPSPYKEQEFLQKKLSRLYFSNGNKTQILGISPSLLHFNSSSAYQTWSDELKVLDISIQNHLGKLSLNEFTLFEMNSFRGKGIVTKPLTRSIKLAGQKDLWGHETIFQFANGYTIGNEQFRFSNLIGIEAGYYDSKTADDLSFLYRSNLILRFLNHKFLIRYDHYLDSHFIKKYKLESKLNFSFSSKWSLELSSQYNGESLNKVSLHYLFN